MKRRDIKQPVKNGVAKVPVIMQLEALECGAASLAMLMAYYDKWVPLEQVRSDCGVSRDGSKAKNIALAAMHYGFEVRAFRFDLPNHTEGSVVSLHHPLEHEPLRGAGRLQAQPCLPNII